MEKKELLIIVNPCSGKAKMKSELLNVVRVFSDADFHVSVYITRARGDATTYISTVPQGKYEYVVVCGGDGTLNEVLTGMQRYGVACKIGYIPSGTLNEWSSGLRISRNFVEAAKQIVTGREISLDIGRFGDRYFSYTASFGAFTAASYSAPQNVKNVLGQAAYFFEGIKSLSAIKPIHLKLECEEKTLEGDFLFGAVSNSLSVGGVVHFDESLVKLNDGLFEVILIQKPDNLLKLQPVIDGILKKDFNRPGIEFFHTKSITVLGGADVSWTLDGEYAPGAESVVITNVPGGLRLVVPQSDLENDILQKNLV